MPSSGVEKPCGRPAKHGSAVPAVCPSTSPWARYPGIKSRLTPGSATVGTRLAASNSVAPQTGHGALWGPVRLSSTRAKVRWCQPPRRSCSQQHRLMSSGLVTTLSRLLLASGRSKVTLEGQGNKAAAGRMRTAARHDRLRHPDDIRESVQRSP